MPTRDEIRAAADTMIVCMFAPHELPLDNELRAKYHYTAKCSLEAAERVRREAQEK